MTAADRYASTEPLIPSWAAPAYLAVSGLAALGYLVLDATTAAMPGLAILKAAGVAMLALYALLRKAPVLALALLASACGDFLLEQGRDALTAGIAAFAIAHLVYIALFARRIAADGWRRDGLVLSGALALYGIAAGLWLAPDMGGLRGPALGYLAVILVMAMIAAVVRGPRLITAGALLFVVSDSILAARWFKEAMVVAGPVDLGGALVWITYWGAQAALAKGLADAIEAGRKK